MNEKEVARAIDALFECVEILSRHVHQLEVDLALLRIIAKELVDKAGERRQ